MRRIVWLLAIGLLGSAALPPTTAFAAFGAIAEVPASSFYSPYGGPATVTFTFDPGDAATIFTVRLHEPGQAAIKKRDYLVDPATQTSPHAVAFSWKALAVSKPTDYVVDVRRQVGGPVLSSAPFTVLPRLVSDLSARPSPFYPLLQDGYKDVTRVDFALAADTSDTTVHVFADDTYGRCCGPEVRTEDLGALAKGSHTWTWDGKRDDSSFVAKGTFYVRFSATDTDDVSATSKALPVEVSKGWIRLTATKKKVGSAYARTGDFQVTEIGGSCFVTRNTTAKTVSVLCANANISVFWHWKLAPGERIESQWFKIDGGYYGCHKKTGHTKTESFLRLLAPPTSDCTVITAKITYSYPVQA
jgi:hypothetical protein